MKQRYISGIIILVFILFTSGCSNITAEENSVVIKEEAIVTEKVGSEEFFEEDGNKNTEMLGEEDEEESEEEIIKTYSYDIQFSVPSWLNDEFDRRDIFVPIMMVENKEDEAWTLRINKLIVERSLEVLPMEKEWLETAEVRITYRSENYLCFEYISHAPLPEGYDSTLLNFTLDLKREQWMEYPEKDDVGRWAYEETLWYEERLKYSEKSVEEQGRLHGESGYEVYEEKIKSGGTIVPAICVRGLEDERLQEQINSILEEPLKALLSYPQDDYDLEDIEATKCYIAYKTPEWLSVVYIIPQAPAAWLFDDGDVEFGVTINMQTGERYMLDDLFEFNELEDWMILNDRRGWVREEKEQDWAGGRVQKEQDVLESAISTELFYFSGDWKSFYLHRGRIVFEYWGGGESFVLPEVYEYLKVDPWY